MQEGGIFYDENGCVGQIFSSAVRGPKNLIMVKHVIFSGLIHCSCNET